MSLVAYLRLVQSVLYFTKQDECLRVRAGLRLSAADGQDLCAFMVPVCHYCDLHDGSLISKLIKTCSERDLRYYLLLWFVVSIAYRFISDAVFRATDQYINIPIMNIPFSWGFWAILFWDIIFSLRTAAAGEKYCVQHRHRLLLPDSGGDIFCIAAERRAG